MNKMLSLLLLLCPLTLSANIEKQTIPTKIDQKTLEEEVPLLKGSHSHATKEEQRLVDKFWDILKNKRTKKTLNKFLTDDFQFIDIYFNQLDKKEFIKDILKSGQILSYTIHNLRITRHNDIFIAHYFIVIKSSSFPDMEFSMAQSNVFEKDHGSWKIKAYENLDSSQVT